MSSEGYLGFANLPNQIHRKSVKKGFEFTLMVVGESGLGKSTLINCLFNHNLYGDKKEIPVKDQLDASLKIQTKTVEIDDKGVKLKLTVVDTIGYNDALDCSNQFEPITNYIDEQFEKFFNHENSINRKYASDTRVHCCFYFINPNNYGLRVEDVTFMKKLHTKVNIVPIIAKADMLTKEEVTGLKNRVLKDIKTNNIRIYSIPECDPDEDEEYKEHIRQLKSAVPFAICASTDKIEINAKKVMARKYPWGIVEVENPEHCDFVKLRSMLVTHMQDLREVTQEVHYENYRSQRLAGKIVPPDNISIASGDDTDKDRILQEKEAELKRMQEMLERMKLEMSKRQTEDGIKNGSANGN